MTFATTSKNDKEFHKRFDAKVALTSLSLEANLSLMPKNDKLKTYELPKMTL